MNQEQCRLPSSIERIVKQNGYFEDLAHPEYILAIAYEACRLQRKADNSIYAAWSNGNKRPEFNEESDCPFVGPLVVEKA